MGSSARVFRMSTSSVPCSRSVDGGMFPSILDSRITSALVDCQGKEKSRAVGWGSTFRWMPTKVAAR
jgi:hypothetical protein